MMSIVVVVTIIVKTITIMEILITTELNRAALWFVLKGNLLPTIRRISF